MIRFLTALILGCFLVSGTASAETVTIKGAKGMKLGANLVLADGKSLGDGAVLIVHGTLGHNGMEIIVTLQELLAERGINSLAPSLALGISERSGMYDCKVPHTHQNTDFLGEMDLWLNWLEGQGAKSITLVGHSRGGNYVAWFASERDRASITKVVMVAPGTWNAEKAAKGFKKSHNAELASVLGKAEALLEAGKGAQMMKGVGLVYCAGADATAESFVSYYNLDTRRDTPTMIPKMKKPGLVIAASEDTVSPNIYKAAQPLAAAGKVELVLVEEAGHFFLDFFAEDMADAIEAFINS